MKVILIKDVARVGRRSEVKEVPSGHALNFLIPRKLAIPATPENMKRLNEEQRKQETKKGDSEKSFKEALDALEGVTVSYRVEANEQGHLFKGVNANDIAKHLEGEGFGIAPEDIHLEHPIKSVGVHQVPLTRGKEKGLCTLEIVKK
jgi:large subunit ribosomal protein L9